MGIDNNEINKEEALTSAEKELILSENRDRLYNSASKAAVLFFAAAVLLMVFFKFNEDFFDASSRFGLLLESVKAQEINETYPKINVRAEFSDRQESKLIIPLGAVTADEDIVINEEFTKNKLIITLKGASESINDGIKLTSDSKIMDAVGIYRQNLDVIIEVYCRETYAYELENTGRQLTVGFLPVRSRYDKLAVLYLPFDDRNRLSLPEWQQSLEKYTSEHNIRLFMTQEMQEPYTQQEVIEFANRIKADAVLGIEVLTDEQILQTTGTAICNTMYFVPGFNSTQLSIIFAESFMSETQLGLSGFEEADENTPLVSSASCPAAMIKIVQSQKDADNVEAVYKLNERLVSAVKQTLGSLEGES